MIWRFTVTLAVVLFVAVPGLARAADFTVPPTPDHFVTDNAGALSADTRGTLESELQAYQRATGHQIIVWVGETTGDVPLETWTVESAHQWRIGRRGHDDGAILFLFMQDHKIRIEVGYGLESALTDADSYRIIQDVIRPRMRAGNVDGAVSSGVAAMLTTITPSYKNVTPPPSAPQTSTSVDPTVWLVIAIVVLSFLVPIIVQIFIMWRLGHLVTSRGSRAGFWGGLLASSGSGGFSSGGGDFDGGGFSAGGGDFGGGGASGSW